MPPPVVRGGSPDPPRELPPARTCRAALAEGVGPDSLPGQVDGGRVRGAGGLYTLRQAWGDALVVLQGGDFSGEDLSHMDLRNICFVGTRFVGADLRRARAPGAAFLHADLRAANLEGASIPDDLFETADLERVQAAGADLSGGLLAGTALGGWKELKLDGADLRRFRFRCGRGQEDQCAPYWHPVSFRNADLRAARIDTHWGDADFAGARLAETQVSLDQLPLLAKARVEGPLVVREGPASVRLTAGEFAWLSRHIAPRTRSSSGRAAGARRPSRAARIEPGTSALFISFPLELDAEARASPLYKRLLPAIVAETNSWVHVEGGRAGAVSAVGGAQGANYHPCSLSGPPLRLDPKTGWYVGRSRAPDEERGAWTGAEVPVLRLWDDRAEIFEEGHPRPGNDIVTCGARAFFSEMTRVPFPIEEARRLWGHRF
jgi:hypothetical protein